MNAPVLTDRTRFPTDAVITAHLGRRRALWDRLFDAIRADYPDCTSQWRYYNDGKSWLLNLSRKKKTIFWLSLVPGTFRITAYFTEQAADAIRKSALPEELKSSFVAQNGRLRGITITFRSRRDVEQARVLVALKTAASDKQRPAGGRELRRTSVGRLATAASHGRPGR